MKSKTANTIIIISFIIFLIYCSYKINNKCHEYVYQHTIEYDTIIMYDTIHYKLIRPVNNYITRIDTIYLNDYNFDNEKIEIPITTMEYSTDEFKAQISGFNATLDYIDIYAKNTNINSREKTIINNKKKFGIGINIGYGYVGNKGIQPYIGFGISYNILTF